MLTVITIGFDETVSLRQKQVPTVIFNLNAYIYNMFIFTIATREREN